MEVISGYVVKEAPSSKNFNISSSFGPENLARPRVVVTDPKILPELWEEHSKARVPEKRNYSGDLIVDFATPNIIVQV